MTYKLKLTPNQAKASNHFKGPSLTLAIPGSGKTTLLISRLIHLVENMQVEPTHILTLTFSKASADDMANRYAALNAPYKFQFMTIHKFAYGIFKQYNLQTGQQMQLLDDSGRRFHILNEIYKKYYTTSLTEDEYEAFTNHIGLIYNLKLKRTDQSAYDFQFDRIFDMVSDYHIYKKKHKLFDFDDMIFYAIKILKANPNALAFYQNRYPFIQVDEAQDTSKLQFELIELLLGPEKNLFIVADDDQSIYGFRGAFPDYLLSFKERFKEASIYYLKDNFRSDAAIVFTAQSIIQKNEHRFDKPMSPIHKHEMPPLFKNFDDLIDRNQYLLDQIQMAQDSVAILYRNRISALSLVNLLDQNQVEYYIKEPPLAELDHWLLQDILAFMNLALIPQDLESFNRIAFKMNGYISREMLQYVNEHIRGKTVFRTLVDIPFLESYQSRTQERLMEQFEDLKSLRPYDAIAFIETELGYLDYLKKNTTRLGVSMNFARTRLDAYKAIGKSLKSGFDFITRIEHLREHLHMDSTPAHQAKVTLSTIHGSKGLEFHNVFMIDVNDQIFPGFNSQKKDALEEERRLFYVGLTRAKRRFELLHTRFMNGDFNKNSLFIEEFLSQEFTEDALDHIERKTSIG
ncbi:ATP-dependent helicase [Fusibacter ferrireducens]|uniref:DNA 3'-5' helicase n=1 Tax=Fusibacter ferrireducens TaxID=2785058 RepID=A0ABR9ZZI1_9FIRM|nr:ATP-dependent helicase [Fusibacter ferrireducens]MBF4695310.1 ATP-dependent helicase [Fusibacter ferrireducens]